MILIPQKRMHSSADQTGGYVRKVCHMIYIARSAVFAQDGYYKLMYHKPQTEAAVKRRRLK